MKGKRRERENAGPREGSPQKPGESTSMEIQIQIQRKKRTRMNNRNTNTNTNAHDNTCKYQCQYKKYFDKQQEPIILCFDLFAKCTTSAD